MQKIRHIARVIKSQPTLEGAGVHLKRVFGFGNTTLFDPFLLISDKPIREPVAWQGPIVMNTQEELRIAFEEY